MDAILKTELWKYCPIRTIKQISQCSKNTSNCILEQNFWSYLCQRDFQEPVGNREKYLKYLKIVQYFTAFTPQITETTLKMIDRFVPKDEWDNIKSVYRDYWYPPKILNARLLLELLRSIAPGEPESDQEEEYYEEWEADGNEERNEDIESIIDDIIQYLLSKYSVTELRRRSSLGRNPDFKELELQLKPIYIKSIIYTAKTKQIVNVDQDYLFTLVEYGLKSIWSEHLSQNNYECQERMLILSTIDI